MIIFHIGLSKAGSSSLQALFSKVNGALFFDKPNVWSDIDNYSLYESFFAEIDILGRDNIVFVSHEHMIMPINEPNTGISVVSTRHAKVLLERIHNMVSETEVIILNRDVFSILQSRYFQYMIQGGSLRPKVFLDYLIFNNNDKFEFIDYRNDTFVKLFESCKIVNGFIYDAKFFLEYSNLIIWLKNHGVYLSRNDYNKASSKNVGVSYFSGNLIRLINYIFVLEKETLIAPPKVRCCYRMWFYLVHGVRYIDNYINKIFKVKRKGVFNDSLRRRLISEGHK
jgi:hypothetical protein